MTDTILTLPTFCTPWGPDGPRIELPGSDDYADEDITDVFFWLTTRAAFDGTTTTSGIDVGPYSALSGTSENDRTIFMFPAGLISRMERTPQLGLHVADNTQRTYLPGYRWPKYPAHAVRHMQIRSDPDDRHTWWQADPTNYSDGLTSVRVSTVANSPTAVLQTALTPAQVTRFNTDGATIQTDATGNGQSTYSQNGQIATGTNTLILGTALGVSARGFVQTVQSDDGTLFPGGQYGTAVTINTSTVVIGGVSYVAGRVITTAGNALRNSSSTHEPVTFWNPDGSPFGNAAKGVTITAVANETLTLANPAWWDRTNEAATVYLPPVRPERNGGVQQFIVDSPAAWLGDERGAYSYDVTIDDMILRGSNADGESAISTGREEWIAIVPRRVTGLVLDGPDSTDIVYDGDSLWLGPNVTLDKVWSDDIYCGGTAENVRFDPICNGAGRHWAVLQGCLGFRSDRVLAKNTERLGIDCETTSATARVLDTQITNAVLAPGTALFHAAPATLNAEPSRDVDAIQTTIGSKLVRCPAELIQSDDAGAILEHDNLPDGTYIRRRMGPTIFEVSQEATATGTADGILYGAVLFRDFILDGIDLFNTPGNVPLDCAPPKGRVYFSYLVDRSTDVHKMVDVQFESRHDGQVFTTADIGTSRVFWGQSGLFPGTGGVPTGHTSTTLTFAATSVKSTGSDIAITGTTAAGSKFVTANVKLVNADVKSHVITAPDGVFRDGTFIERLGDTTSVTIELNVPAKVSGTFAMTVSGRARGYFAGDATVRWSGFQFSEIRPMKDALWNGTGIIPAPANQPCIMAPNRTDDVTISRNAILGQRSGVAQTVARYIAGAYQGNSPAAYGIPPDSTGWVIEDNYGPSSATTGMLDNQRSTPTVTVDLTMTAASDTSDQPVFTIVGARSDDGSLDGKGLVLVRDGQDIGPASFNGDTAVFRSEDFTIPLDPGDGPRAFWARWGNTFTGGWDTLPSISNVITIRPGDATSTPTATVLGVSPSSPQVEGTTLTLTATVTPTPTQAGTVSFYDGVTLISTHDLVDGVAVRVLGTGRTAGSHALSAVFNGTAAFDTSTSNTVTFVATAAPVAVNTTTSLAALPPTQNAGGTVFFNATVTPASGPAVNGGRVNYKIDGVTFDNPPYGTPTSYVFDTAGTYAITAQYVGNASWNGSTSNTINFIVDPAPDTTPPVVVDTTPDAGEELVSRGTTITVVFNEGVSLDDLVVTVLDGDSLASVPGVLAQIDDDGLVFTFTPVARLDAQTRVVVRVDGAEDSSGNVADRYTFEFSTGGQGAADVVYPVILHT